jgi:8-oxo-dGTP diphosphatase
VKPPSPRIRVAGVLTRGEDILLVEHERAGRRYYLLPGGGLEWGETCAAGLAREFLEEVSLKVKTGELLFINESIEPAGKRHIVNLTFRVRLAGGALRVHADRRLKAAAWVPRAQVSRLAFYPAIRRELLQAWKRGFKQPARWLSTPWE